MLTAIEPPFSDILEFPETFRVFGYNLSPGRQGSNSLVCKWNNEDAVEAEYIQQDQTLGDDISHIECPATGCHEPLRSRLVYPDTSAPNKAE